MAREIKTKTLPILASGLAGIVLGLFGNTLAAEQTDSPKAENPPVEQVVQEYQNEPESLKKARELIKSIEDIYRRVAETKSYDLKDKEIKKKFETDYKIKGDIKYTNNGIELSKDSSIKTKMSSTTFSEDMIYHLNIKNQDNIEQKIVKITLENENKTSENQIKTDIYLVNKNGTYLLQATTTDKNGKIENLPDKEIKQETKEEDYNTISICYNESSGLRIFINKKFFILKNRPDITIEPTQTQVASYLHHDKNEYSVTITSLCDKMEIPYIVTNNVKQNSEESKDKK